VRASVVIPTFNRLAALQRVLAALAEQWRPPGVELEVVVVDDGSSDGTAEWLRSSPAPASRVLTRANAGPATARNRGVEAACGELVLFLGDDTVPQPGWLAAHLEDHRLFDGDGAFAVLGYTAFPVAMDSPFRRHINEFGAQFGYALIDDPCAVPFNFFYTSNVSLPRAAFLRHGGFREDFPAAAWEDIEFAYRAARQGLRMRYQPRARTLHEHCVRPWTFCRRQMTSGLSAAIFHRLHPELGDFLGVRLLERRWRAPRLRCALLALLVAGGERLEGVVTAAVYRRFLDLCYIRGLAAGLHSR
jgi:GT2 family glycosyltransferase